jgi:hypothetical protein
MQASQFERLVEVNVRETIGQGRFSLSPKVVRACFWGLRVAPWVTFGPITGLMSERAIHWYRNGDRVLAGLYVVANVCAVLTIPLLTAIVARQIH